MAPLDLTAILGLVVVSFCVAAAALIAAGHLISSGADTAETGFDPHGIEPAVFLFDGRLLVDATDRAMRILRRSRIDADPWAQFMDVLSPAFTELGSALEELPRGEMLDLRSENGAGTPMRLFAEWRNDLLRITVVETAAAEMSVVTDAQSLQALEDDAALLGAVSQHAPCLIWKTSRDGGEVTWANRAYLDLARQVAGNDAPPAWPPQILLSGPSTGKGELRRISLAVPGKDPLRWYETAEVDLSHGRLHFAVSADGAVRAEGALREFIQTLAKTFAHLPIGLAIFNRDRRLALFNPALTDLSSLPVDFLSARPTLATFLDELRNRRVMPEPKDYQSWRQQITALEDEAARGTYSEFWSLPSGQTFRVTGRPHPEGAIAFLFEDISVEVSLTRRFRKDMALGQAVVDAVPEALAVFSADGILTMSNAAYAGLWGVDPKETLGDISIIDAIRRWIELSEPSPAWGEVRDFVSAQAERGEWSATVRLTSGRGLDLRCLPLPGGEALVGFTRLPSDPTTTVVQPNWPEGVKTA